MLIQLKLSSNYMDKLERKARDLLQKYNDEKYKWVFFSGGKDSMVALDLANKYLKDFTVIYVEITGNTHPKCTKYARRIVENYYGNDFIILKNDVDFFECLADMGYPSFLWGKSRWCLDRFKVKVVRNYTKGKGVGIAGVSPNDSVWRKKRYKNPVWTKGWTQISISPLHWFTKDDVWLYIYENELEVNPLYKELGYSGNCMLCPAMRPKHFEQFTKTEFFEKWKKAHEKLREAHKRGELRGMKCIFSWFNKRYEELLGSNSNA